MKKQKRIFTYDDFSKTNLNELNSKELSDFSNAIRKYIIQECSINGGHLASNLGVIELTVAIHKAFNLPTGKLLFDVGHQCYTHKILSGRSLTNLRKENGVDGFQKREESIYDSFEAGHSSTSISAAMGMAIDRDLKKENYEIIALIGDASISNGLALEALNNMVDFNHKIIVIINDNDMSISQPVGAFHNMFQSIRLSSKYLKSKEKYRKIMQKNKFTRSLYNFTRVIKNFIKSLVLKNNVFEMFGFRYIGNVDGYDFKEMDEAFKKAKKVPNSVVIHVSTIKGKGYDLSENSNVASWHSVKPFDINTGKPLTSLKENQKNWFDIYASFLDEELNKNKSAILINPNTTIGSGIEYLFSKYKEQTFDVGISEEHAITLASGYSLNGSHSYVSIYSSFMQRAYDQINHDIARMNLPVTLLIDRAGLVGSDGETHQGIFDESFLIDMPNMTVAMPKDISEAKALFNFSTTYPHPLAIRIPLGIVEEEISNINIEYGKWIKEQSSNSNKLCLITFGPKLKQILRKLKNKDITILNALWQSPLDVEMLKTILDFKNIIIYNPYGIEEGFIYHSFFKLDELGYKGNKISIGLKSAFIKKGSIEQQEKRCQVDLDTLYNKIDSIL